MTVVLVGFDGSARDTSALLQTTEKEMSSFLSPHITSNVWSAQGVKLPVSVRWRYAVRRAHQSWTKKIADLVAQKVKMILYNIN